MSLMLAKQLREKRANIATLTKANLEEIQKAETTEARKQELLVANDRAFKEADELKVQIDQYERAADLESEIGQRGREHHDPRVSDDPKERKEQVRKAMSSYLRYGREGMTDEERGIVFANQAAVREALKEQRDLSTATSGAVLPNEYWNDLEETMLAYGGVREVATVIRTANGNPFVMPTVNDTANKATLVSEASQTVTSVDPTIASLTLNAYTYRSFMLVSREMLQDNAFDIDAWVTKGLATRLARGLNTAFTTGTGSSQPKGVVTGSSAGVTMAASSTVAFNDLTGLLHSLDPAYRKNAKFMMADSVLKLIKQMVDSQSRPLWLPGVALREPDTILGHGYVINQDMASLEASAKGILFGDFSKYIIRDVVGQAVILRLNERYADYGQVGYFLFSRHDGDVLDAGTDPLKHAVAPSP